MLRINGLTAGYHGSTVLHGLDLTVPEGTVHALVGHNGAGKTTAVHTVAGLITPRTGHIALDGVELTGRPAHRIARAGVGLVPQGRRVFAGLTVAEHLRLSHRPPPRGDRDGRALWDRDRVLELLPRLAERRGNRGADLSGGEQQMLALARALLGSPRVLLLDEPTEGLAPVVVDQINTLIGALADEGMAILLVSPSPTVAALRADTVTVLTSGRLTARLEGSEVRADPSVLHDALALG